MTIVLKNKASLQFDDFVFHCAIGKKGLAKNKFEGDKKTPIGTYSLGNLYYRKDRNPKPVTKLKCLLPAKLVVYSASAFALATFTSLSAFDLSTLPLSHVHASSAIGLINKLNIYNILSRIKTL